MEAPANPFTQIASALLLAVPVASLILHLVLKPRFWTPSLIILCICISALSVGEYMHSKSLLIAARNGVVFGLLFFLVSVVIGLVIRLFFLSEYAKREKAEMQTSAWHHRSRILSVVAMIFGAVILGFGWTVLTDMKLRSSIVAAVAFYLGYRYWRSSRGAASVSQWLMEGDITQRNEPSNSTMESDARKDSARGSP